MSKNIIPPINQPDVYVLVTHVNTTGKAIYELFMQQEDSPTVSRCDALLHALSTAETAVRKLRVRLFQKGNQYEKQ